MHINLMYLGQRLTIGDQAFVVQRQGFFHILEGLRSGMTGGKQPGTSGTITPYPESASLCSTTGNFISLTSSFKAGLISGPPVSRCCGSCPGQIRIRVRDSDPPRLVQMFVLVMTAFDRDQIPPVLLDHPDQFPTAHCRVLSIRPEKPQYPAEGEQYTLYTFR